MPQLGDTDASPGAGAVAIGRAAPSFGHDRFGWSCRRQPPRWAAAVGAVPAPRRARGSHAGCADRPSLGSAALHRRPACLLGPPLSAPDDRAARRVGRWPGTAARLWRRGRSTHSGRAVADQPRLYPRPDGGALLLRGTSRALATVRCCWTGVCRSGTELSSTLADPVLARAQAALDATLGLPDGDPCCSATAWAAWSPAHWPRRAARTSPAWRCWRRHGIFALAPHRCWRADSCR